MEPILEPEELQDDVQYEQKVLRLTDGRNENDLDDQYMSDAVNLGVSLLKKSLESHDDDEDEEDDDDGGGGGGGDGQTSPGSQETFQSCNTSSTTSFAPPRSASTTSRHSCSTGLTYPSRHSKEYHFQPGSPLPVRSPSYPSLKEKHSASPSKRSSALSFLPQSAPATTNPSARYSFFVAAPSPRPQRSLSVIGRLGRFSVFRKPGASQQPRAEFVSLTIMLRFRSN